MKLRKTAVAPATLTCLSLAGAGLLLVTGCPNPNTYSTPRTAGHGKISHTTALEAWGWSYKDPDTKASVSGTIPTLPTYQLRIGIGDRFELGARLANLSSVGADVKWNFLRSRALDLALDPAFQTFRVSASSTDSNGQRTSSGIGVTYLHLPLMVGFNFSRSLSLVLTPGVTWAIASGTVNSASDSASATAVSGAMARLGVGLDIRVSQWFGLQPEITFLRAFNDASTLIYLVGIGFNFGERANYDDVDGPPPPPPGAYPPAGYAPPPPGYAPPPPAGYPPPGGYPPPAGYAPAPAAYPPPANYPQP